MREIAHPLYLGAVMRRLQMTENQLSGICRASSTFTIAPHVHVCVTGAGSVLLDLKRDKYLGLGREETESLAAVIDAWPKPTWDCPNDLTRSAVQGVRVNELCITLATDGILIPASRDCETAADASDAPAPEMKRDWISIGDELEVEGRVTLKHVLNFATAFIWARCSMAWRPLFLTVEFIRKRKSCRRPEPDIPRVLELAALVDVFRRLRPVVFAAEGRCLLHALTLIRFLSRYGFYPDWVIGVATQPWAAHSWVQWDNFLLDSNPEKVCRFQPILVV
jgi:Transglutaminase-like superfamily